MLEHHRFYEKPFGILILPVNDYLNDQNFSNL